MLNVRNFSVTLSLLLLAACANPAQFNGSQSALLTLVQSYDFATVYQESQNEGSFNVRNVGQSTATAFSVVIEGEDYLTGGGTCHDLPFLNAGKSCSVEFSLMPESSGDSTGNITLIYHNGATKIEKFLTLHGVVVGKPGSLDLSFGIRGNLVTNF